MGDYEAAVDTAQSLPDDSDRLHLLAIAYQGLGRETESTGSLAKLVEVADDNWDALNVAEVFAQRGDIKQALSWLERIHFEPKCEKDNFAPFVYYSPFLANLDGTEAWETYRTNVLQIMRNCLLELDLSDTPLQLTNS
jgi:tetratricopeptide (TPR) repeat protein